MNVLGVHLTMLIGPTIPVPAPTMLLEALESVEVAQRDEGRSGFQITFQVGRSGLLDLLNYELLSLPSLRPFSRVILIATFNVTPQVLMDGIITHQQLAPSNEPGNSILTVTGEDVSVMMDMEEKSAEHPAQDETAIAAKIILSYAQYGLTPIVMPPPVIDPPIPTERTPVQQETDFGYLKRMAARFGYLFYLIPGPVPLTNRAYWGPPKRLDLPQKALSVNMGTNTNVESINFQHDALEPEFTSGQIQDRLTDQSGPVATFASTRPFLVSEPTWLVHQTTIRRTAFRKSGLNVAQAFARAQGKTDASMDNVVTATGELDALRYDDLLRPRELVGVRGVGYTYDGLYYVKQVTHNIKKGEYKQSFTLTREGVGSITPLVRP